MRNKSKPLGERVEIINSDQFGVVAVDPDQFVILLCEFLVNSLVAIAHFYGKDSAEKITISPINTESEIGISISNKKPSPYPEEISTLLNPYISEFQEQKYLGLGFCICHAIASRFSGNIRLIETIENDQITFSQEIIFPRG